MMTVAAAPMAMMTAIPMTEGRNAEVIKRDSIIENISGSTVKTMYLTNTDESRRRVFVQRPVR